MKPFAVLTLALLTLTACNPKADFGDESVVGPDLGHAGPFAAATDIVMTDPTDDETGRRRIEIRPGAAADDGVVVNMFSNTSKPFNAGVSYHRFTPVVAETNAEAKTYWLVGFNLTRTPDRSVYMVLRYPKGLDIKPGTTSDAFEYLSLNCSDLDVARHPADYYKPLPEGQTREEPALAPAPEADACEFNNLAEAYKLTGLALKKYDQIKHYDSAPQPTWRALHVEVN